ncbi:MAG TPA: hypothetical protein VK870_14950 [Ignavibacteriaceae bacterium]|nr:hypothetical protein [Ignavibacteriaceae bacterium]
MKILVLFALVSIQFTYPLYAQYNPGARQIAMSNSDVALSNDVFAVFNNPSGLAQMNWREVGVYYSPAPFGISEMANGYIAYHEPTVFGSLSIGGMTYGFDLFRESKIKLSYAYNYLNKFFGGVSINYHNYSIQNYGSQGAFYLDIGGLTYLTNEFKLGFIVHNLNRASLANVDDQIPTVINLGVSYDLMDVLSVNMALEKDISFKPSIQFGIDYELIEYLSLRTGFSNQPSRYSAGIGINYSIFSLDYAFFTHQDLGLTHQTGVIISFGKEMSRTKMIKKYLGLN